MKRSPKRPKGGVGELLNVSSSGDETKSPINGRRKWLFRITAVLLVPAVFIVLELVLRLAGYGYDPHFFKKLDIGGKPFLVQNEDFSRRFFPPETMRQPNALRMRAEKPPGSIRIFVFGESAAMGDPEPGFGPSRYLEVLLQLRFPQRDFEIVNVAFTAINSHVILPLASECAKHDGDLWIIYMGNNEMVGPYGAATILGAQAPPRQFVRLVTAIQRTRVGQLGMAMMRKIQKPSTQSASWGGMAMFEKQRVAPKSPKREAVYANFAGNLQGMLNCALDSGAGVILNTMAVNLHDSPPFASLPNELLTPTDRTHFDEFFQSAVKAQAAGDWPQAAALFERALQIDEGFAEAHYRRAVCLERIGRLPEAQKHYQLSCDTDALPFRTDSRINASIREAAGRHSADRVLLVDAPAALAKETRSGLCGQETFYEHVHFNFDGGYHLGLAWAQAVEQMLPKDSLGRSTNDWASQSLCERRIGLTDWNRKLVAQSVMQRFKSPPLNEQFNNPERIQRLSDYERNLLSNANEETVVKAREIFAEAIGARPDDHYIYEAFGVFLQSVGDLPGAIQVWHKVGELLPHDFLPWFEIGSLLAKQGKHSEGQPYLRQALAIRPGLIEGWSELGQSLGASGQFPPALEAFQRASQLRPADPVFWAFRAKVLASMERRTEAVDCYRKAVELNPSYAEAHAALGDQYSMGGKTSEAISEYEAAIRTKPDYAIAHLNLGLMFVRQGRLDEAITEFRRTLSLEPGNQVAKDYLKQVQTQRKQSQ